MSNKVTIRQSVSGDILHEFTGLNHIHEFFGVKSISLYENETIIYVYTDEFDVDIMGNTFKIKEKE